jgi:hypothetical protein
LAKRTGSSSNHSQAARRLAKFHGFSPPHNDPVEEEGGGSAKNPIKTGKISAEKIPSFYFKTA